MAYYNTSLEASRVLAYARRYGIREHPVMKQCRLETVKARPDASIMTMPEEASFLGFFIKAIGAKRGLEVGVFTGYSSLSLALSMPDDSELVCLELNQETADIAKSYWELAGVDHRVKCHVGEAAKTLEGLVADESQLNSFDFSYIDANKDQYDEYYEASLKLVKPGGTIILDNMLWGGKVVDKSDDTPWTLAIRELNEKLHKDERIEVSLTTLGDGVTFARKL